MLKIQKVSHFFRFLFFGCLIILPLIDSLIWIYMKSISESYPSFWGGFHSSLSLSSVKWTATSQFIGWLGDILPTVLIMYGLYQFIQLFKLYEQGRLFELKHVQLFKKIGYVALVYSLIAMPISGLLSTLALTWNNPVGQRVLSLTAGTPNIQGILIAFLILLISWIMNEGYKLKKEISLTV